MIREEKASFILANIDRRVCDDELSEALDMAIKALEQQDVLDKIRAEIKGKYRIILKGTPKDDWAVRWNDCIDEVLQIIDKYKAESEVQR